MEKMTKEQIRCSLSHFIIKPQLHSRNGNELSVVLYLISSSNHNRAVSSHTISPVVLYLISSSNHNSSVSMMTPR